VAASSQQGRARLRTTRPLRIVLIALGVALFLAISGLLARFLSVENVERDDILSVLDAQAAGNAEGMLDHLDGCRATPSCVAIVQADARRLRTPGSVKILSLTASTAHTLTSATGFTRVAWTVIGRLPTVECVRVKRTGSFISGMSVALLSLSAPISNEADC
jgi:hypothetical protein